MTAPKNISALSWLACRAASHLCALPLKDIIETMRPLPVEAFPRAPAFVAGLSLIRGAPTPVVDMRALMGEPAGSPGRFVTTRINARVVALAFDNVAGVYQLSATQAINLPPLLKNVAGDTISMVTSRDADLLLFFETTRIFPPSFMDALLNAHAAR